MKGAADMVQFKIQTLPPYGIPPPTFRLPDATFVGAVHLQVSDLQQSLAYYEHVVGLRPQEITRVPRLSPPVETNGIW
jgi:catechol-2,3-dioxygenase